jgi:hypothetical protein
MPTIFSPLSAINQPTYQGGDAEPECKHHGGFGDAKRYCGLEPDKDRLADERQGKGADETGLEHGLLLGESSVRRLRLKVVRPLGSGYINPALLAIP